jgi:hypothetical protein
MKLIYIANALITILVTSLLLIFKDINNYVQVFYIILLAITLEIPTIYSILAFRKKLSRNDNELLVPSFLITLFMFIVDSIFYSICIGINNESIKLLILYTIIFHVIITSILLVIKAMTNYIRNQHK